MSAAPVDRAVTLLRFVGTHVNGNRALAAQCIAAAKELAELEALRTALRSPTSCRRCGGPISQYAGRGRRRTYCTTCRPSRVREKTEKFNKPGG